MGAETEIPWTDHTFMGSVWAREKHAKHRKGGDPDEWRPELRVRRFPLS